MIANIIKVLVVSLIVSLIHRILKTYLIAKTKVQKPKKHDDKDTFETDYDKL